MTNYVVLKSILLILFLEYIVGNENSCQSGDECGTCVGAELAQDHAGKAFCCRQCNGIPIIQGGNCTCFNDEYLNGRIIFPDSSTAKRKIDKIEHIHKANPVYIPGQYAPGNINQKEIQELISLPSLLNSLGISYPSENSGIKRSLDLLAETMYNIDQRLRTVENVLGIGANVRFPVASNTVHGVLFPSTSFLSKDVKCKPNFRKMGDICIYVSQWADQRANWRDADEICKGKGAQLIEIKDHAIFTGLSNFLSTSPSTAGFSFWIGSVNPGAIWMWMPSAERVSLSALYWKRGQDEDGRYPSPGDTSKGNCLRFHYDTIYRSYHFQGMECAKDSFFICQMLTRI